MIIWKIVKSFSSSPCFPKLWFHVKPEPLRVFSTPSHIQITIWNVDKFLLKIYTHKNHEIKLIKFSYEPILLQHIVWDPKLDWWLIVSLHTCKRHILQYCITKAQMPRQIFSTFTKYWSKIVHFVNSSLDIKVNNTENIRDTNHYKIMMPSACNELC